MSEAKVNYGTINTEKLISIIAGLIITGYKAGKDGIQISDITVLPSVLIDIINIINKMPEVTPEIKDLSLEEIKVLLVKLIGEVQRVLKEVK